MRAHFFRGRTILDVWRSTRDGRYRKGGNRCLCARPHIAALRTAPMFLSKTCLELVWDQFSQVASGERNCCFLSQEKFHFCSCFLTLGSRLFPMRTPKIHCRVSAGRTFALAQSSSHHGAILLVAYGPAVVGSIVHRCIGGLGRRFELRRRLCCPHGRRPVRRRIQYPGLRV